SGDEAKLIVISGQHIPKPDQDTEGEIVDPYVVVKIVGHPADAFKTKTGNDQEQWFQSSMEQGDEFFTQVSRTCNGAFCSEGQQQYRQECHVGDVCSSFHQHTARLSSHLFVGLYA
ncbi:hypothetical protein L9F63_025882, partial [Diploptera punctata]